MRPILPPISDWSETDSTAFPAKKRKKSSACSVALLTTIRNSGLRFRIFLRIPRRISVLSDRSCASSTMITEYRESNGSTKASRSSRPSVRNLMRVEDDVTSSKRIE